MDSIHHLLPSTLSIAVCVVFVVVDATHHLLQLLHLLLLALACLFLHVTKAPSQLVLRLLNLWHPLLIELQLPSRVWGGQYTILQQQY